VNRLIEEQLMNEEARREGTICGRGLSEFIKGEESQGGVVIDFIL
jgi:hypothetical protein